jgi:AcrR family transcriptional regulator
MSAKKPDKRRSPEPSKAAKSGTGDPRAARTRRALLDAFFTLAMDRRYEDIQVNDIIERAGVGRSTFYEHFSGKNAILAGSLKGPFTTLADATQETGDVGKLTTLLTHFRGNRALLRSIFSGSLRERTLEVLTRLIEQRLVANRGRGRSLMVPTRLAAVQLAEALMAPIAAWVNGESNCAAEVLALSLHRTSTAIITALYR